MPDAEWHVQSYLSDDFVKFKEKLLMMGVKEDKIMHWYVNENSRDRFSVFNGAELHKGFYNDGDPAKSLLDIPYSDFGKMPEDDEFPYWSSHSLLYGSCNHFALSLNKKFGYNVYMIQGNNKRGFHAFCQIYKNRRWYYVDARGITTSFDEFMSVAKTFVNDEYTITAVDSYVVEEWDKDNQYNEEAYAFAEALIDKFEECYTLD